jgi:4-alpha-glucanotransferase
MASLVGGVPGAPVEKNGAQAMLAASVIGVLAILILPLPPLVLDMLLALNIGVAVLILLVGLSLEDLVGEAEPVNVPGVGTDQYPAWQRRLTMPLEALATDPSVRRALGVERAWVGADRAP